MSNQIDLTVDICVLRNGSRIGNPKHYKASYELMDQMIRKNTYLLCIDSRKKIQTQYSQQLRQGTFGNQWLILMASKNKMTVVKWHHLDRGTTTALKEAHFDSSAREDYKYVVTAAGSKARVLVSYDPDYSPRVQKILRKRLKVSVVSADKACP